MDDTAAATLHAATEVSRILAAADIPHAIIGAMALAAYGYSRATADFDFGTVGDPFSQFRDVARSLRAAGYQTELVTPDADDPLGGVITIERDGIDPIQLVNFWNPLSPETGALGRDAIAAATAIGDLPLRVVDVQYLVLLKLYAGGLQSRADAFQLLSRNPAVDIAELRERAAKYDLRVELEKVLREL